jgi:Spy/CpxP family protein refolding chaperone
MNTRKTFAAAAIALGLTVPAAFAQESSPAPTERHMRAGKRGHGFGGYLPGRVAAALNLTDQQKEFAKQLRADTRKQAEPITAQLRQNRRELAEAIKANNLSGIDQITQRQAPLMAQLSAMHAKARASFYAQLTPEQKARLDESRARFKDRAARRMKAQK